MQNVQRIRSAQFKWLLTFYIFLPRSFWRYKSLLFLKFGFGKAQSHVAPIDATYAVTVTDSVAVTV